MRSILQNFAKQGRSNRRILVKLNDRIQITWHEAGTSMQISDEDLTKIKNGQITSNRFDAAKEVDAEKLTAADFEDYSDLCRAELPGDLRAQLAIGRLKNAELRGRRQENPLAVCAVIVITILLMVCWCLITA